MDHRKKTDKNIVVAWIDEEDDSAPMRRKKAKAVSLRAKRCKVCGVNMNGTFFFTGHQSEFQNPTKFPRMAMHMSCAKALNEQERFPILARNAEYKYKLSEGVEVGSWIEYWLYGELRKEWQAIDGGHGKVPSK